MPLQPIGGTFTDGDKLQPFITRLADLVGPQPRGASEKLVRSACNWADFYNDMP